jgi:hypothetical protein
MTDPSYFCNASRDLKWFRDYASMTRRPALPRSRPCFFENLAEARTVDFDAVDGAAKSRHRG